jgi:hypothetical protein
MRGLKKMVNNIRIYNVLKGFSELKNNITAKASNDKMFNMQF